ncbi:urease accessory protein UreE [Pseudomonas neustonica]|uniref:urease accessory protein UreE n=1 Tax=Pseudomonas neustonica TaxID=2487346 RepID=UPI003F48486F
MLECHEWLEGEGGHDHVLELSYELRTRSRLRAETEGGLEVGLFLPRGRVLAQGERLQCNDGSVLMISAAPEQLSRVHCDDALLLARAAYHMGNRHVALEVRANELRYLCDHVLDAMLRGFGLEIEQITAPFNPESGAYHNHSHSVATPAAPFLRLAGHDRG